MLLAQLPPATETQLGSWVVLAFLVLMGAVQIKQLLAKPQRQPGEEFVRRAELVERFQSMQDKLGAIAHEHEKLANYTHESVHDMRDQLNILGLKLEANYREIQKEIGVQVDRVLDRISHTDNRVERLVVLLEQVQFNRPATNTATPEESQ